jgi:Pretoxin HINT domain
VTCTDAYSPRHCCQEGWLGACPNFWQAHASDNPIDGSDPSGQIGIGLIDHADVGDGGCDARCVAATTPPHHPSLFHSITSGIGDGFKNTGLGLWHGVRDPVVGIYDNMMANRQAVADGQESALTADLNGAHVLFSTWWNTASGGGLYNAGKGILSLLRSTGKSIADGDPRAIADNVSQIGLILGTSEIGGDDGVGIGCGAESFVATTAVLMADGTTKAIGKVHIGDTVLATNTDTGANQPEAVTDTDARTDTDLADLTVQDSSGHDSVIHTTSLHPYWSDTRHTWVLASHLHRGEQLHSTNGRAVTVVDVKQWTAPHAMLGLTINQLHDFYVIAGTTPVLVHNCPPGNTNGPPSKITVKTPGANPAPDDWTSGTVQPVNPPIRDPLRPTPVSGWDRFRIILANILRPWHWPTWCI